MAQGVREQLRAAAQHDGVRAEDRRFRKDIELTGPFTNDDETWQPRSRQVGYRGIAPCPEQSGQAIW
jgi:hypothetical protein